MHEMKYIHTYTNDWVVEVVKISQMLRIFFETTKLQNFDVLPIIHTNQYKKEWK